MQTPIAAVDSAQKYMVNTKLIHSGGVSEYLRTPAIGAAPRVAVATRISRIAVATRI
jgi:hypothetical protein